MPVTPAMRPFVRVGAGTVALTHVKVIDGTGAAPRADQTVILSNGQIAAVGKFGEVAVPASRYRAASRSSAMNVVRAACACTRRSISRGGAPTMRRRASDRRRRKMEWGPDRDTAAP